MTCAKQTVECTLYSYTGRIIGKGSNACANPQPKCPRKPGEDYAKCASVCQQQGHAEMQALADMTTRNVLNLNPYFAVLSGHTYACQQCQEALFRAGVQWLKVLPPQASQAESKGHRIMTSTHRIDGLPDLPKPRPIEGQAGRNTVRWGLGYNAADMEAYYLKGYEAGSAAAAQAAKQVPDGFVLVPREPTYAMQYAAERAYVEWSYRCDEERDKEAPFTKGMFTHSDTYRAMIALAPSATSRAEAVETGQVEARWTIIAPDGWKLTGDKPITLIVEANKHEREINPVEAERQNTNLMESIAEEQAEHERDRAELVNRFLRWKLPADFSPDAGITFKRVYNETSLFGPQNHEPTGTNLLSGSQARAMLDFILDCDEGDRELAHRSIATTPASPQAPAPQAVVGEASEAAFQPLPYATPHDLWKAFHGGTKFVLHYHGKTYDVTHMERREKVVYVQPPGMPVKVFPDGRSAEGDNGTIWLAALTYPAPSAAPHQGADALREAPTDAQLDAACLRHTQALQAGLTSRKAMLRALQAAALAHHQAPQQGEQHE